MHILQEGSEDNEATSFLDDIFEDESVVEEVDEDEDSYLELCIETACFEFSPSFVLSGRPRDSQQVVTLYSEMDTSGAIGGVHSGKVLKILSISDDGRLKVVDPSTGHTYKGISWYNPMHKHNQKLDCRDRNRVKEFIELPYILTRLFQYTHSHNRSTYEMLCKRFRTLFPEILGIQEQQRRSIVDSGMYRVRFEFFCGVKNLNEDIILPVLPIDQLIYKVDHKAMQFYLMSRIDCINYPLMNFWYYINDLHVQRAGVLEGIMDLTPEEKTTLVYATEQLVNSMEIMWGQKRGVTKFIETWLKENFPEQSSIFSSAIPSTWTIPVKESNRNKFCLRNAWIEESPEDETERLVSQRRLASRRRHEIESSRPPSSPGNIGTNHRDESDCFTYHYIKSMAYCLERRDFNKKFEEDDFKRLPKNYPNIGGKIYREVQLPKLHILFEQVIRQEIFDMTLTTEDKAKLAFKRIPILSEKNYRIPFARQLTVSQTNKLISKFAFLCHQAYFFSVVMMFRCRRNSLKNACPPVHTDADLSIKNFPRTQKQLNTWLANQREGVVEGKCYQKLIRCDLGQDWAEKKISVSEADQIRKYCFFQGNNSNRQKKLHKFLCVHVYAEILSWIERVSK